MDTLPLKKALLKRLKLRRDSTNMPNIILSNTTSKHAITSCISLQQLSCGVFYIEHRHFFFRTLVLRGGPTRHESLRKRVLSITNSDKWFGLRLRILLHEKLYDDVIFSGTFILLLLLLFTLVFSLLCQR